MLVLHIFSWECYLNLSNCRKRKVRKGVGQVRPPRKEPEEEGAPGRSAGLLRPPRRVCHSRVPTQWEVVWPRRPVNPCYHASHVCFVSHGLFDITYLF